MGRTEPMVGSQQIRSFVIKIEILGNSTPPVQEVFPLGAHVVIINAHTIHWHRCINERREGRVHLAND